MDHLSPLFMLLCLVGLVLVSAFCSSAETGMMALNRYKLRHLARAKHKRARRVVQMLERPDRLLGVILITNTFANNLASVLALLLAQHYFAQLGVVITLVTLGITLVLFVFAEMGPKIVAALYPQQIAFFAVLPLSLLLRVLYPLVWVANLFTNSLLRLCGVGVQVRAAKHEQLNREELRTLLREAADVIADEHQRMLLQVLDLEDVVVEDIMVPRSEVYGIDLDDPWETIVVQLQESRYAYVPLYRASINCVEGMLHVRKVLHGLLTGTLDKERLLQLAEVVYFIPEGTVLARQLLEFRSNKKSIGLVVDEYGELQGLLTIADILEEIVGEFSTTLNAANPEIKPQKDGGFLVDGGMTIRDLNRLLKWELPTDGPKTLSGLIVEQLEAMPQAGVSLLLAGHPVEILSVSDHTVDVARINPQVESIASE